eukprot:s82_g21.t1
MALAEDLPMTAMLGVQLFLLSRLMQKVCSNAFPTHPETDTLWLFAVANWKITMNRFAAAVLLSGMAYFCTVVADPQVARAGFGVPWRTNPIRTKRRAPSFVGSGRRSARAGCKRSAARCVNALSEEVKGINVLWLYRLMAPKLSHRTETSLSTRLQRCVLPQGPLKNLTEQDPPAVRRELMRSVRTPVSIRLRPDPVDCGEDGIVAVNLARPFDLASSGRTVLRARQRAAYHNAESRVLSLRGQQELRCQVTHFIGGPCEEEKVACCVVASASGYSIVQDDACLLAALTAAEEGRFSHLVEISCSLSDSAAEGAAAALRLSATESSGISSISTSASAESDGKETPTGTKRRRINLEASGQNGRPNDANDGSTDANHSGPVRVFVYWGYAGWSRCQLMGEIARGSWGLCKANTQDVVSQRPDEVWQAVYPRLVFAPKSDMSESYGGESPQEGRRQQLRRMAIIHDLLTGRGDRQRDDEDEEIEAEADEDTPERAALAEDLDAADADGSSAEEAEESAAIVTDSCEDVSGEECEDGAPPTGAVQDFLLISHDRLESLRDRSRNFRISMGDSPLPY